MIQNQLTGFIINFFFNVYYQEEEEEKERERNIIVKTYSMFMIRLTKSIDQ